MAEKINLSEVNLEELRYESVTFDAIVQTVSFRQGTHPRLEIGFQSNAYMGSITKWGGVKEDTQAFLVGKVYTFTVVVGEPYKGTPSLTYDSHTDSPLTPQDLTAWETGYQEAAQGVYEYCQKISHTTVGKITVALLQENWEQFRKYPAASSNHHKYLGGLLVHSYTVATLCEKFAEFYNTLRASESRHDYINVNLVICGALIHDIGKLIELSFKEDTISVEYSTESFYMNHLQYGAFMVYRKALEMGVEKQPEVEELIHLVSSHHGNLEWGALIEPCCAEARLLAEVDKMDADITKMGYQTKNLEIGHGLTKWEGGKPNHIYKVNPEKKDFEI